jgi:hypothetical protein
VKIYYHWLPSTLSAMACIKPLLMIHQVSTVICSTRAALQRR